METDSEVIRLSLGAPDAFSALYERHAAAIYRYSASRVGTAMAEDVVSETFLEAFRRRARFDVATASALPWLLGIATVMVRRHRRAEAKHLTAQIAAVDAGIDVVADPAIAGDEVRDVLSEMRRMPRGDREVLLLNVWADLPYDAIAAALDIPVGTVRSRLHRARSRLRSSSSEREPTEQTTSGRTDAWMA